MQTTFFVFENGTTFFVFENGTFFVFENCKIFAFRAIRFFSFKMTHSRVWKRGIFVFESDTFWHLK